MKRIKIPNGSYSDTPFMNPSEFKKGIKENINDDINIIFYKIYKSFRKKL